MNKIPPVRPLLPEKEQYFQEIASIWQTGAMTNYGEKTDKLRQMLIDYLGCPNLDLFVNGHSALTIAIQALELTGEVITSPFTFVSTTNAIVQCELTPVFGDIDDTYNLDPNGIEKLITPKTTAIITPHIFGIPCDVDAIARIAEKHDLKVIYDGAQAFGTKIHGKSIACYGDATMFSFHATKVFNTIEGGALVYRDADLHDRLVRIRNFGIAYEGCRNEVYEVGGNAKMNEFQAAMGIVNLPQLEEEIEKRRRLAMIYKKRLVDVPGIETYPFEGDIRYNFGYFPIKVRKETYGWTRDELWEKLKAEGIVTRKLYDTLTCDYVCYQKMSSVKEVSNARKVSDMSLDLPLYGALDNDDIEHICGIIAGLAK